MKIKVTVKEELYFEVVHKMDIFALEEGVVVEVKEHALQVLMSLELRQLMRA